MYLQAATRRLAHDAALLAKRLELLQVASAGGKCRRDARGGGSGPRRGRCGSWTRGTPWASSRPVESYEEALGKAITSRGSKLAPRPKRSTCPSGARRDEVRST